MINPSPAEVEGLMKYRLVGFNCRKYDNHILYAAMMGYNNKKLYQLSKDIIDNIGDTCDIIENIKPVYNFKASENG